MTTKEKLIEFFNANDIYCEPLENKILFVYKKRNLLVANLGNKVNSFSIEVVLSSKDGSTFEYATLEEIKSPKHILTLLSTRVENKDGRTISEGTLLDVLQDIVSTDYISQTSNGMELFRSAFSGTADTMSNVYKALCTCSKNTLLQGAEFLKRIADSIPSENDSQKNKS